MATLHYHIELGHRSCTPEKNQVSTKVRGIKVYTLLKLMDIVNLLFEM